MLPPLHEIDERIFTAPPHGRCVCPFVSVDSPASPCERHGVGKTGVERLYCRVLISSFLAHESTAPKDGRPGTALAGLLKELGLKPVKSCNCDQRAAQMDAWGVAGCIEHRAEIVAWLNEQAAQATWGTALTVGMGAYLAGIAINPLSPGDALVDEALRRAEAAK